MSYLSNIGTRSTPQTEPIPGEKQVRNSAGGFVYEIDSLSRLRRFLVLGAKGGTYYAGQRELARENALAVREALNEHGLDAVDLIVEVSERGLAPSNDEAIFALAVASSMAGGEKTTETRRYALSRLPRVARTASHLFLFASLVTEYRGWGRGLRRAVAAWYRDRGDGPEGAEALAYQVSKYRERYGFTHERLLDLSHPRPRDWAQDAIFRWAIGADYSDRAGDLPGPLIAADEARRAASPKETAALVLRYGTLLSREALRTEHLPDPEVRRALATFQPLGATIRNLGNMSKAGILGDLDPTTDLVCARLRDPEALRRARIHPFGVLLASATYGSGRGFRGGGEWDVSRRVMDALDDAFYASFETVEPTGLRWLVALDVSGSMGSALRDSNLSARAAAAAMAMATVRSEERSAVVAFSAAGDGAWRPSGVARTSAPYGWDNGISPLSISPRERIDDVVAKVQGLDFGRTDCALPMLYAMERGIEADVFVIYTDNETFAGTPHPSQALREYRARTGIGARLIVVGITSTGFSIADPEDAGMMDVVGFDSAAPGLMADFARGAF